MSTIKPRVMSSSFHHVEDVQIGRITKLTLDNGKDFYVRHIEIQADGGEVVITLMADDEDSLTVGIETVGIQT